MTSSFLPGGYRSICAVPYAGLLGIRLLGIRDQSGERFGVGVGEDERDGRLFENERGVRGREVEWVRGRGRGELSRVE